MKIDLKSAVIGLLFGIAVMLGLGARGGGAWMGQIGFSVPQGHTAIVRGTDGEAFVIDTNTLTAMRILFKEPVPSNPRFPNVQNGRALRLGD